MVSCFRNSAVALTFFFCLTANPFPVWAETALSERQALQAALDSHPSVDAARAALKAVAGEARDADAWFPENPTVRVDKTTDRWQRNVGKGGYSVELAVPLWIAGQRSLRQELAAEKGRGAEAEIAMARWALSGATRENYWKAWLAGELVNVAKDRGERSRALVEAARRLKSSQQIRALDARQMEAEASIDKEAAAERRAEHRVSLAALRELTGMPLLGSIALAPPEVEAPPTAISAKNTDARPDIEAAARQVRIARANLKVQDRDAWPVITPSVSYRRERSTFDEPEDRTLTFGLTVPLPVARTNQAGIGQAGAELVRAETELRRVNLQAQREVEQAHANWQGAWERWQQSKETLQLVEQNVASLERGFASGEVGALELLQERRRWVEAREAERSSLAALAMARSAWQHAQGVIGEVQ